MTPTAEAAGLSKPRIEALAEAIFAVAMTLLVLALKMPECVTCACDADLWRRLVALEPAPASYAVSFVMLSVYWVARSMALVFYSPRRALYRYLALPLLHMLPGRLDRMTLPSPVRRRRSP
jgi:uncharacterized membrane protein